MPMSPIRGWTYYAGMSLVAFLCFATFLIAGRIHYPVVAGSMLTNMLYMIFFMFDAHTMDKRKAKFQKEIAEERRRHEEYVREHR